MSTTEFVAKMRKLYTFAYRSDRAVDEMKKTLEDPLASQKDKLASARARVASLTNTLKERTKAGRELCHAWEKVSGKLSPLLEPKLPAAMKALKKNLAVETKALDEAKALWVAHIEWHGRQPSVQPPKNFAEFYHALGRKRNGPATIADLPSNLVTTKIAPLLGHYDLSHATMALGKNAPGFVNAVRRKTAAVQAGLPEELRDMLAIGLYALKMEELSYQPRGHEKLMKFATKVSAGRYELGRDEHSEQFFVKGSWLKLIFYTPWDEHNAFQILFRTSDGPVRQALRVEATDDDAGEPGWFEVMVNYRERDTGIPVAKFRSMVQDAFASSGLKWRFMN